MTQKLINTGTSANKGDGDPLRLAFEKINDNFTELYTGSPIVPQDLRGSVFGDDSTLLVDGVNSSIPKANIEDSTNWDTAFGWGNHSTAGYADGTNEANWNTAFGWGNHSTAGYLTSYTVTESDVTTHQAALSITESQITDLAHYDDTALATRVTTLENAGYITSETDSQELSLVGTDLSISSGNTVDLSGFLTSVPAQTFASLTGTPTTIAGYGITDALALGTTSTTALAGDTALFSGDYDDLSNKPTIPTAYTDSDVDTHLNQSSAGSNEVLSWDGADYAWVAQSGGGGGTFALAGNTGTHTFNTATETLTFLGTTGQINAGIAANNITLELDPNINSIVSISFEGATADEFETKLQATDPTADRTINLPDADGTLALTSDIPTAYTDSDVDTHLNTGSAGTNEVLSWTGSDYDWVAQGGGGSGLQSRSTATGTTSSLADAAQADLDITGFKAYTLLTITTDRAARVRLYVSAATRTADASRAEGVDPTSDAGLIAEVITTGAETVIISPGAYGFNLESSPTTNIPCRVTNKSGGASTVQVDLNILQLEA